MKTRILLAVIFLGYIFAVTCSSFPVKIAPIVKNSSENCPQIPLQQDGMASSISNAIENVVNPKLNMLYGPVCDCGGPGWTKVVDIDMTNSSQQCPSAWNLYNSTGIRGCGRSSLTSHCDSVVFPVNKMYSRVCGKIVAYQRGDPDGFDSSIRRNITGIDQPYVDGVSVTHGAIGSRHHIWTFVSGDNSTGRWSFHRCSCSISTLTWPHHHLIPSFIGNNYFCENGVIGSPIHEAATRLHLNPLWDGMGCSYPSTCCQFNNPPWFCVPLSQPVNDNIEVRLCLANSFSNEDIIIKTIDIYVR